MAGSGEQNNDQYRNGGRCPLPQSEYSGGSGLKALHRNRKSPLDEGFACTRMSPRPAPIEQIRCQTNNARYRFGRLASIRILAAREIGHKFHRPTGFATGADPHSLATRFRRGHITFFHH
jgi:hypothetical protein